MRLPLATGGLFLVIVFVGHENPSLIVVHDAAIMTQRGQKKKMGLIGRLPITSCFILG